ncbi:MAG: hypothetical protein HKO95_13100 [Rhodobacteraceae bacterium]|nr:hypothetical protein [Alphaproteobacteria bacterium]MBT8474733.1 hypothetical protein [Alphaproteobacteria bacterium]NNK67660.1 hypothetical protein [Paracoccaceae bacterium]
MVNIAFGAVLAGSALTVAVFALIYRLGWRASGRGSVFLLFLLWGGVASGYASIRIGWLPFETVLATLLWPIHAAVLLWEAAALGLFPLAVTAVGLALLSCVVIWRMPASPARYLVLVLSAVAVFETAVAVQAGFSKARMSRMADELGLDRRVIVPF